MENKSKDLVLILYLILTYHVLKGADTAKLQNRTQEIAIHPDHKKLNLSERGGIYRIKIAAKNNVGTGSK